MADARVTDVSTLRAGDHIRVWEYRRIFPGTYPHHGLVYKAGKTADDILIAHHWFGQTDSALVELREKTWMVTSLTEFLHERPLSDVVRVIYNGSTLGEIKSRLGDHRMARCDTPPIIMARCEFLLGKGRGHASLATLNCTHMTTWCTTGFMYSKLSLVQSTFKDTPPPFYSVTNTPSIQTLENTIESLRKDQEVNNQKLLQLNGKRVYLKLAKSEEDDLDRFVKKMDDGTLASVVHDVTKTDLVFRNEPTPFVLKVQVEDYNLVIVEFEELANQTADPHHRNNHNHPRERLCATSHGICMASKKLFHRAVSFAFEYTFHGELQSRRNHRWYIGVCARQGTLRICESRDHASRFEITDADEIDRKASLSSAALGVAGQSDLSKQVEAMDLMASEMPHVTASNQVDNGVH